MSIQSAVLAHTGKTALAGIFGWPVAYSQSPRLHAYWLAKHGIDGAYVPLAVEPNRLEHAIDGFVALGFRGGNVTLPYKEKIIPFLSSISPLAEKIGAVNTLIVKDGKLHGTNTDAPGFMANLKIQAPNLKKNRAVVLGAGGAARAICAALADDGFAEVIILNRTADKADVLARNLSAMMHVPLKGMALTPENWAEVAPDADLLVNTTAMGMFQKPPLDIDLTPLPDHAVVADVVYAPLETDLLKQAKSRGLVAVDGLGMLLYQAKEGFEAWFGVAPEVDDDLRSFVISGL